MNHLGTKTLITDRLVLRRFTQADSAAMFANWASDPAVAKYMPWDAHPDEAVTQELVAMWVDGYTQDGYYNWLIALDGKPVGSISVVRCNEKDASAEIGYTLGRAWWGDGLMTEALRGVLAFLFGEVGLHRVMLRHDVENIGSGRVMVKNGLTHEGTLRKEHRRRDGTWGDIAIYGMLREEWQAVQAAD